MTPEEKIDILKSAVLNLAKEIESLRRECGFMYDRTYADTAELLKDF